MWRRPAPPPHVSIILDSAVRLEGLTRELRGALEREGIRVRRDLCGHSSIRFVRIPGDEANNVELVRIVVALARLGFAFASDYKQGWSPAATALGLRERGLLHGDILACGFDGSRWHVYPAEP